MPKPKMTPARKSPDPSTYSGRFAIRLRALREKAGFTVQEMAEKIGVKPVSIYQWEQGARSPHISDLPALAKIYKFKRTRDILPEK